MESSREFRKSAIGIVGAEEDDESGFLRKKHGDSTDDNELGGSQRLRFPRDKIYGRKEELAKLQELYQRCRSQSSVEVVLITGYSGCGKTALVREFLTKTRTLHGGNKSKREDQLSPIFIRAKYEEPSSSDSATVAPYRGILEALSRWYRELSRTEKATLESAGMRKSIKDSLGEEDFQILVVILPALRKLLLGDDQDTENRSACSLGTRSEIVCVNNVQGINQQRVTFAFRVLLKCICNFNCLPLIFFGDDIQWADQPSLDLLLSLLATTDEQDASPSLFVILSMRSNTTVVRERSEDQLVKSCISKANEHLLLPLQDIINTDPAQSRQSNFHTLELNELPKSEIRQFIADTLHFDDPYEVSTLSDAIYSRSLGNIFFTIQALEELERQNFLYFDLMTFQWAWTRIEAHTEISINISDNILDLIVSKLRSLSKPLQNALTVAAYTRATTLDLDTWLAVYNASVECFCLPENSGWEEEESHSLVLEKYDLLQLLNDGVQKGLLHTSTINSDDVSDCNVITFAFTHDQIQEAARELFMQDYINHYPANSDRHHGLLLKIGHALVKHNDEHDLVGEEDWILFTATQVLNSVPLNGHGNDEAVRLVLARLNYQTAKVAIGRAAFEDAGQYAAQAIRYLPDDPDPWKVHTAFCKELFALAIQIARCRGNVPDLELYSDLYLKKAKQYNSASTMIENLFVYYNLALGLVYCSDRYDEAKDIVLALLKDLGITFPSTTFGRISCTIGKLLQFRSIGNSLKTIQRLENLDFMTEEQTINQMLLLNLLFDISYITNDEILIPLVIFEGFGCTLRDGLSLQSPRFVGSLCIIFVAVFRNIPSAGRYAQLALQMMKQLNDKSIEAAATMVIYPLGICWTKPVGECITPVRNGYKVGMYCAEVDHAMGCVFHVLLFSWQAGIPLPVIDIEWRQYMPRMEELGQRVLSIVARRLWAVILHFLGEERENFVPLHELSPVERTNPMVTGAYSICDRMELGYSGDLMSCAQSACKIGTPKAFAGNPFATNDVFVSALSCFVAARSQPSCCGNPYRKKARQLHKLVSGWTKQGNPNALHWKQLLDAEFSLLKKRNGAAEESFCSAAETAVLGGYVHDAAIINERYGLFLSDVQGDIVKGREKLRESYSLFRRWGAIMRANQVRHSYSFNPAQE